MLGRQRSLSDSQADEGGLAASKQVNNGRRPLTPLLPHQPPIIPQPQPTGTLDAVNINAYRGSPRTTANHNHNNHHLHTHCPKTRGKGSAGERRASFAACAARASAPLAPPTNLPLSTGSCSPQVVTGRHRKYSLPGCLMPGEGGGTTTTTPEVHVQRNHVVSRAEISEVVKDHYRVVFLGPPRVGKTAIISQFLYDRFVVDYKATVEEMHRGEYDVAGCPLTLDILDTSGSNEFPAMRALSISNADAFVLVYAIDDANTFDDVRNLRDAILAAKQGRAAPTVVVGNKCDLRERRQVSSEAAETIVSIDWENGFVEASAKDNVNIVAIFKELLAQANVRYALSPAVRRRRQSLPNYSPTRNYREGRTAKRNSCALS